MELNYKEIAQKAAADAEKMNLKLDYTMQSIETLDQILDRYHENLAQYPGEEGEEALWNIAVRFGIYLGETLLRSHLAEKGFAWEEGEEIPILKNESSGISPITKVHKRILNGYEDNIKSFSEIAVMIADGRFSFKQEPLRAERRIDIRMESGYEEEDVQYEDIYEYILLVANGEEDFLVMSSDDGFLEFYGIDNEFICDTRVNLPDGDFRTYQIINQEKEDKTNRIHFETPYGEYTPEEREVVSLDVIRAVVKAYYENGDYEKFIGQIPCVDNTLETKQCMGLIK